MRLYKLKIHICLCILREKGALYYNVHLRNGQGDEDMVRKSHCFPTFYRKIKQSNAKVYWIEEWASQAVFDAHMETQHVKEFLKEIKELMDCELEIM